MQFTLIIDFLSCKEIYLLEIIGTNLFGLLPLVFIKLSIIKSPLKILTFNCNCFELQFFYLPSHAAFLSMLNKKKYNCILIKNKTYHY